MSAYSKSDKFIMHPQEDPRIFYAYSTSWKVLNDTGLAFKLWKKNYLCFVCISKENTKKKQFKMSQYEESVIFNSFANDSLSLWLTFNT